MGSDSGSGMMIQPKEDPRLFLGLHQRHAANLHPVGARSNPDDALAAIGTLAHEMGHARDAADGRPGAPRHDEVASQVSAEHVDAVRILAESTLSEYIGCRTECIGQVALRGACSAAWTRHSVKNSASWQKIPELSCSAPKDSIAASDHRINMPITGYVLGALAAYVQADAPLADAQDRPSTRRTSDIVWESVEKDSTYGKLIQQLGPALEDAATTPNARTRGALAKTVETAFEQANEAEKTMSVSESLSRFLRSTTQER